MNFNISISDTSIPYGVVNIIKQLPEGKDLSAENTTITLSFPDSYLYKTGLVLLAAWRKTLPNHVKVVIDDSRCLEAAKRVLTNTGFRELMESNAETPSNIHYFPGKVPIQPIVRGYSTEHTISNICKIFESSAGQLDIKAFRTLLSELCENTFAHSNFETPGYISAHLHKDTCEIAIADSGIGILNSYLEGTNIEAKNRISHGTSAIELAMDGLSSSKPTPPPGMLQSYYGYGLFIVRRLIEENGGRLMLLSGKECINVARAQKTRTSLEKTWNGTFVGLLIDLQNPLPLEAIYEEGVNLLVGSPAKVSTPSATALPQITRELNLSTYGNQLLTREMGIAIRADLATMLSSGAKVKVTLDGVEDLTPSVADECFGKLAESMGEEKFKQMLILAGGQPIVKRLIDFVVGNRLSGK